MVELKKEEKIIIAYTDHCIEKPGAKYKKIKKKSSDKSSIKPTDLLNDEIPSNIAMTT